MVTKWQIAIIILIVTIWTLRHVPTLIVSPAPSSYCAPVYFLDMSAVDLLDHFNSCGRGHLHWTALTRSRRRIWPARCCSSLIILIRGKSQVFLGVLHHCIPDEPVHPSTLVFVEFHRVKTASSFQLGCNPLAPSIESYCFNPASSLTRLLCRRPRDGGWLFTLALLIEDIAKIHGGHGSQKEDVSCAKLVRAVE